MRGIVLIDKPSGMTSHDTVQEVKKILKVKKAGHSGTLDYNVTGVLIVALDEATKAMPVLMGLDKTYIGKMRLHGNVEEKDIEKICKKFIGKIIQIPPVKSRVVRKAREREIYSFDILKVDNKNVKFKVRCQAGTYIRKLCVSGNTDLIFTDGIISKIEDFATNFRNNTYTISYKNGTLSTNRILDVQKLPSPKRLFKIKLDSGIELKLTDNHPILISKPDGPEWISCKDIKEDDFVFSPRKISIKESLPYIVDLLDNEFLVNDDKVRKKCISEFRKKYGSIREASRMLKTDRKPFYKSDIDTRIKYIKAVCDWNEIKKTITTLKTERGNVIELKDKLLTEDILYLLGLIASDGYAGFEKNCIYPNRIKFYNSKELTDKFADIHKNLFPSIQLHIKTIRRNLIEIDTHNTILANIAYSLGIICPEEKSDFKEIFKLPESLIAAFLKGYFDCNGGAYYGSNKRTKIEYYTVNYKTSRRLYQLLKRLGIRSKIYRKNSGSLDTNIYIVALVSPQDKLKFIEYINSNHSQKKAILQEIKRFHIDNNRDIDYVPFHTKKIINRILDKNKIKLYHLNLGGNFRRVMSSEIPLTKYLFKRIIEKLNKIANKEELKTLNSILNSEFYIEKIKSIKQVESKNCYIYNMTVDSVHNFIPHASIVVSNCHDFGQELGCGAQMIALRRTEVGPFKDKECIKLEDLKKEDILELEDVLERVGLKKVDVNDRDLKKVKNGVPIKGYKIDGIFGIYNKKKIIALGTYKDGKIKPERIFIDKPLEKV